MKNSTTIGEQLATAIEISVNAHKGQIDKAGKPYILHPLYVSEHCNSLQEKIVAWLHDTIEDTSVTLSLLESCKFDKEIIDAIDIITKKEEDTYMSYIKKVKSNYLARQVKIEDLKHNMMIERIKDPNDKDFARLEKYKQAYEYLTMN